MDSTWLGLDSAALLTLPDGRQLRPATAAAWQRLQQAARAEGLEIAIASAYRDFARQCQIWNAKFDGRRPVLDEQERPLDMGSLSDEQKVWAILRWSALPGTSRHHWGTDLDIYAPALLPPGQTLQLTCAEYAPEGYFAPLTAWLDNHLAEFGFDRPYRHGRNQNPGAVTDEPWHISFLAEAGEFERQMNYAALQAAIAQSDIAGKAAVLACLPAIWQALCPPPKEIP
ncbi:M15 family metallopeptidase [Pseudaeromonas sp. ZJS20]|uniref:M15 family metallopeptidase n=1 Tax=Pseudaeromonas aegiceratis TaxID=3153928 RepID=UPI00390CCA85